MINNCFSISNIRGVRDRGVTDLSLVSLVPCQPFQVNPCIPNIQNLLQLSYSKSSSFNYSLVVKSICFILVAHFLHILTINSFHNFKR